MLCDEQGASWTSRVCGGTFGEGSAMILVVGATGDVGGNIARRLLERQNSVRVLVREGSNYAPLIEAGAQAAIGDLKDSSSLGPACAGIETVVTTANSAKRG